MAKPAVEQPFEVRRSGIQGHGGFATRRIEKGERVIEYAGDRITWAEADRRYDDEAMDRHHTFLFSVSSRTVIDGAVGGNDSRFINHSCDPNCEAWDVRGRIFIEATRTIEVGEELTYDYAFERDASTEEEDEALYACRCGAATCRGTILAPREEPVPQTHHPAARHTSHHLGADTRHTSTRRSRTRQQQ